MKKTRFDLEQEILDCWGICDDLQCIFEGFYEEEVIDRDKLAHIVLGMKELYHMKFSRTFNTFETLITNGDLN